MRDKDDSNGTGGTPGTGLGLHSETVGYGYEDDSIGPTKSCAGTAALIESFFAYLRGQ